MARNTESFSDAASPNNSEQPAAPHCSLLAPEDQLYGGAQQRMFSSAPDGGEEMRLEARSMEGIHGEFTEEDDLQDHEYAVLGEETVYLEPVMKKNH